MNLGNLKSMSLDLTTPEKFKFEDLEYKNIVMYVGKNGTGKSFIMAMVYAMAYIAMAFVYQKKMTEEQFKSFVEYVFKYCFNSPINGSISVTFKSELSLNVTVEDNVVTSCDYKDLAKATEASPPVYFSSNFRLFTALNGYLQSRKDNGLSIKDTPTLEFTAKMLKRHKLYDFNFIETIIGRYPITLKPEVSKMLEDSYDFKPINLLGIDDEQDEFYVLYKDGEKQYCRTLGAGHQAVLNMFGHMN